MKLKTFLIITAVLGVLFGASFFLFPAQIPAMHGVTADEGMKHMAQNFGGALLGIAVMSWAARNSSDSIARRSIVLGLFVLWVLGAISAILFQLTGIPNNSGWTTVAFQVPLAVVFGYFLLKHRGPIEG